jgi:hypothetical protein
MGAALRLEEDLLTKGSRRSRLGNDLRALLDEWLSCDRASMKMQQCQNDSNWQREVWVYI